MVFIFGVGPSWTKRSIVDGEGCSVLEYGVIDCRHFLYWPYSEMGKDKRVMHSEIPYEGNQQTNGNMQTL